MDELSLIEKNKYERMWAVSGYRARSPGERCLGEFLLAANPPAGATILDLGVGCGRAAARLQAKGYKITGVDLTDTCLDKEVRETFNFVQASLWDLPPNLNGDYGYCTDVMEHIPPEKVDDVIREQIRVCNIGCFYQIATFEDSFGRRIGDVLHLTIKPTNWWHDRLIQLWPHVELVADTRAGKAPQFWCRK